LDDDLAKIAGVPVYEEEHKPNYRRCPRCGEINSLSNNSSNNFCTKCGWDFRRDVNVVIKSDIMNEFEQNGNEPPKRKCSRCNYENLVTNKFCSECGIPFHNFQNNDLNDSTGGD